jgi:hypothetical protein
VEAHQRGGVEGLERDPVGHAVPVDRLEDAVLPLRRRVLEVDEEPRPGAVAREHGVEGRRLGRVVEPAELLARELIDGALVPGRARQGRVVDGHEAAVGGGSHVELERVGALGERQVEGGRRVLRRVAGRAAVRDHLGQGKAPSRSSTRAVAWPSSRWQ